MNQQHIIRTSGLNYRHSRDAQILHNINLCVEAGSIYGFLGPNGAGKTTTLSLLLGLLKQQEGNIEIFGQSLQERREAILSSIGALIETPSLYGHLTAKENLEVYRNTYGATKGRVNEVLEIAGIPDTGGKVVKKFSLGMKQRLAIALALLPNPQLLILDEPTNGLDPNGIIELRALIKKLNQEHGMTILISSHLLSEVEKIVSHVGIIYKGRMVFQGALADLHRFQQKSARLLISTSNNEAAMKLLKEHAPASEADGFSIPLLSQQQTGSIQRMLIDNKIDVHLLQPKENDLEQLFLDIIATHA